MTHDIELLTDFLFTSMMIAFLIYIVKTSEWGRRWIFNKPECIHNFKFKTVKGNKALFVCTNPECHARFRSKIYRSYNYRLFMVNAVMVGILGFFIFIIGLILFIVCNIV